MQNFREKETQVEEDKALGLKLQAEFNRELLNSGGGDDNTNLSSENQLDLVECAGCHTKNRVAAVEADAFLCGMCNKELKEAKSLHQKKPAESETYVIIQVQCGQCNVINEVQVLSTASSIQFKCGGCESINEAEIQ